MLLYHLSACGCMNAHIRERYHRFLQLRDTVEDLLAVNHDLRAENTQVRARAVCLYVPCYASLLLNLLLARLPFPSPLDLAARACGRLRGSPREHVKPRGAAGRYPEGLCQSSPLFLVVHLIETVVGSAIV